MIYRDLNFYAPVLCRLTEAVFKIRFAPAGKQLSAVFLNSKIQYGPLAQLGERQVRNLEVRGSIPLWSTIGRISEPYLMLGTVFVQTKRHFLP